jgi:hypothetical protein
MLRVKKFENPYKGVEANLHLSAYCVINRLLQPAYLRSNGYSDYSVNRTGTPSLPCTPIVSIRSLNDMDRLINGLQWSHVCLGA